MVRKHEHVIMVEPKHVKCYESLGPLRVTYEFESRREIRNGKLPGFCVRRYVVSLDLHARLETSVKMLEAFHNVCTELRANS